MTFNCKFFDLKKVILFILVAKKIWLMIDTSNLSQEFSVVNISKNYSKDIIEIIASYNNFTESLAVL